MKNIILISVSLFIITPGLCQSRLTLTNKETKVEREFKQGDHIKIYYNTGIKKKFQGLIHIRKKGTFVEGKIISFSDSLMSVKKLFSKTIDVPLRDILAIAKFSHRNRSILRMGYGAFVGIFYYMLLPFSIGTLIPVTIGAAIIAIITENAIYKPIPVEDPYFMAVIN